MGEASAAPETYRLAMFPLGSPLVPGALLPLHVFEDRYRAMVRDVLDGDRRFGVVMIERGSEVGGGDVRSPVGCLAQIVDAEEASDGRWVLLALGGGRVRVEQWLADDPYPLALVEDWPDEDPGPDLAAGVAAARTAFDELAGLIAVGGGQLESPRSSGDAVQALAELVALSPVGPLDRYRLLTAPGPDDRCRRLIDQLDDVAVLVRAQLEDGG